MPKQSYEQESIIMKLKNQLPNKTVVLLLLQVDKKVKRFGFTKIDAETEVLLDRKIKMKNSVDLALLSILSNKEEDDEKVYSF